MYYLRAVLLASLTYHYTLSTVSKQSALFIVEESHNGIPFKQVTELENGAKKESFFINNKPVPSLEFEDTLLNAEKEESKKERKKTQEERIKIYETQYKGRVKIGQNELKQAINAIEHELNKLSDERIKPFMLYQANTIASPEQLNHIKEKLLSDARKLMLNSPEAVDIRKISDMTNDIRTLTPRVRELFIVSVNNGINKADDTKLLKELLSLI